MLGPLALVKMPSATFIVYYDKKGKPESYSTDAERIECESINELLSILNRMKRSISKPILWAGDQWPGEFDYDGWIKNKKE